MKEFVFGGLLISPFVKYALIAGLLFAPTRSILVHLQYHRWLWHPLLSEAAIYLCLLAFLNVFW